MDARKKMKNKLRERDRERNLLMKSIFSLISWLGINEFIIIYQPYNKYYEFKFQLLDI